MNLKEFGQYLGVAIKGDPDYAIDGVGDIERLGADQHQEENKLYFVESNAVLKRHPLAADRGAVLTTSTLADRFTRALIAPDKEIRLIFIKLLQRFDKTPAHSAGISPQAHIHPSAKIDPSAAVLPGAVIMEGAAIGAHCVIYPNAVIESGAVVGDHSVLYPCTVIGHHCVIGKHCIIHAGTVIGADGFGFYDRPGQRYKIPQIGNVVIADHVEIGASCTVDRATIESTTVGIHTKIDDQVHIGHNCQIGRYVYIVGNTAIGGSVTVEDAVMISGMVIIKDHLRIAKGSIIMGLSGVAQDTEPGQAYFGTPARPAREMHRMTASLSKLPEMFAKVRQLEEKLAALPEQEPVN